MTPDLDELKQRIVAGLDETELLDILGLDISDLVDLLEEQIDESSIEIKRALG